MAGSRQSMELACRNATEKPTEANLVRLLDLCSADWKHRGRTRAVGLGAYERYATLGLYGGVVGVSNATGLREACNAVNGFLRSRLPNGTWTRALQSPHGPAPFRTCQGTRITHLLWETTL